MDLDDDEPPPDETISLLVGLNDFDERVYEEFHIGEKIVLGENYAGRVRKGSVGEVMSIIDGRRVTRHCWVYFGNVEYGSNFAYFDKNFEVRVARFAEAG